MDQRSGRKAQAKPLHETETDGVLYAPQDLAEGISVLTAEPVFADILERAAAMHPRLVGLCRPLMPGTFLTLDDATLRSCGFSRQKMGYARDLAAAVERGSFDFVRLAASHDETALAAVLAIRGIGRWSAEIYLLFALGRPDIWPAADLGLQLAMAEQLGLGSPPAEAELRLRGEAWRPWRSVAACLFWQSYLHARGRVAPRLPPELYA